jgi:hypothetical protein
MELVFPFAILALLAFPFAVDQLYHEIRRQRVCAAAREFGAVLTRAFVTQPCSRCQQRDMGLLSVGPHAGSIRYECRHCQKELFAAAASLEAAGAGPLHQRFESLLVAFNGRYRRRRIEIAIVFRAPDVAAPRREAA